MRKLHVVGFTTDLDGLIFSTRKGSKSGSFVVSIGDELLEKLAEAERLRDGDDATAAARAGSGVPTRREEREAARGRSLSELTPREIQARLRAGRSIDEVAKEARCTREWVERFAAPILAEQAQVVELARGFTYSKARLGDSALPLGDSVAVNLVDKGVLLPTDEFDQGWSAFQLHDGVWLVRFHYRSRGRLQQASWEVDLATGRLISRDRLASDLGYVDTIRSRRAVEMAAEAASDEGPEPASTRPRPQTPRRPRAKRTSRARKRPAARKVAATKRPAGATKARATKARGTRAGAAGPGAAGAATGPLAKGAAPRTAGRRRGVVAGSTEGAVAVAVADVPGGEAPVPPGTAKRAARKVTAGKRAATAKRTVTAKAAGTKRAAPTTRVATAKRAASAKGAATTTPTATAKRGASGKRAATAKAAGTRRVASGRAVGATAKQEGGSAKRPTGPSPAELGGQTQRPPRGAASTANAGGLTAKRAGRQTAAVRAAARKVKAPGGAASAAPRTARAPGGSAKATAGSARTRAVSARAGSGGSAKVPGGRRTAAPETANGPRSAADPGGRPAKEPGPGAAGPTAPNRVSPAPRKKAAGTGPTSPEERRRGSGGAVLRTQTRPPAPPPVPEPPAEPPPPAETGEGKRGRGARLRASRPAGPRFGTDGTQLATRSSVRESSRVRRAATAAPQPRPPARPASPPPDRSGNGSRGAAVPPLSERLRRVPPSPPTPPAPPSSPSPPQPESVEFEAELEVEPDLGPPKVRASIFGERPSPATERPTPSKGPIALEEPDDLLDEDEDDRDDKRSRPGDWDADPDAFVIRPRISAKQASELTFSDERPSWRARLRKSGPDLGPSSLSALER